MPGGRPKKEFDLNEVYKLGQIQATHEEMASFLECARSTVEKEFSGNESFRTAYKKGIDHGKISLRRLQLKTARGDFNPAEMIADLQAIIKSGEPASIIPELKRIVAKGSQKYKSGNPTMQIWLGKQFLGQKDHSKIEHTGAVGMSFAEGLKMVWEHIKSNPDLMAKIEDEIRD